MVKNGSKTTLEKFLSIFTEVRSGEGISAILLMLNIFLILTSYYIMKPVREALILAGGFGDLSGAVVKSITAAGQVVLLMGAVPLYGWIASRIPRRRLINVVTIFFTACLVLFYILALSKIPLGVVFFLWIGIFNLMVPAQFWAFSNDLYTNEAGKRIFVLIAFGASSGAVLGGIITDVLIEPIGIYQLLLVAGGILLGSLIITNFVDTREKGKKAEKSISQVSDPDKPMDKGGAFRLVFKNRYLLLIAFLMLLLNWVNTTGEYILGQKVENTAKMKVNEPPVAMQATDYSLQELRKVQPENEDVISARTTDDLNSDLRIEAKRYEKEYQELYVKEYIGNFYAQFFTVVNLAGLLMQLFLVSRILKYLGVRVALIILPFIAFTGYLFMAFYPFLAIIRWAKTAENATDYSLQNTVRQVLFLPTTREEKYKAKQAIDTFFWRAGDLLSTALVIVGTTILAFQIKQFALVNLFLVVVWLGLAFFIGKENLRLSREREA